MAADHTPSFRELLDEQLAARKGPATKADARDAAAAVALPAIPYTPQAMLEHILQNPGGSHADYAKAFGRTAGWFATVLASESFQSQLDAVRHLVHDPAISATLDERFRGLALRSLQVLHEKLDCKEVSEFLVTKSAELSVKALGMGQVAPALPAPAAHTTGAEAVANRIMEAMASAKARTNAAATDVTEIRMVDEVRPDGS